LSVPELITTILSQLRHGFYSDKPPRDFKRDERALTKAIARWGYECHQRGWDFTPSFIRADITELLNQIKRSDASIQYLPVYLDGAIRKRIGLRSEELQAAARAVTPKVNKIVDGVQTVVVREVTATETLALLYKDLRRRKSPARSLKPKEQVLL
jgi:hypothetical protein